MKARGIGAAPRGRQIVERHRIEVVVRQRDEPEPKAPQLDDLLDDTIDAALSRLLSVRAPHRAERAMLRTAAHGLNRRPHVSVRRQQVPSRRHELVTAYAAALIEPLGPSGHAVADDSFKHKTAVAAN